MFDTKPLTKFVRETQFYELVLEENLDSTYDEAKKMAIALPVSKVEFKLTE